MSVLNIIIKSIFFSVCWVWPCSNYMHFHFNNCYNVGSRKCSINCHLNLSFLLLYIYITICTVIFCTISMALVSIAYNAERNYLTNRRWRQEIILVNNYWWFCFLLFVCLFSVVACQALSVPGPSNAVKKQTASLPQKISKPKVTKNYHRTDEQISLQLETFRLVK